MPAKIDLHLTLPDGDVTARRDYPIDEERRDRSDPARQADEREWVAAELPTAIEQLYARAGLERPRGREYDELRAKVRDLINTFPIPSRPRLHSVDDPALLISETVERVHLLEGDIDAAGHHFDALKDALQISRDDISDADAVAMAGRLLSLTDDDIRRRLTRLAVILGFPKDFDGMDEAVTRQLERTKLEAVEEGKRLGEAEAHADLLRALDIRGETDDPFEAILGVLKDDRSESELKIIEALGAEASRLRFEIGTLLDFFQLPVATPDEKIAARIVEATTKAIAGATEGVRAAERKAGPDVEEGARQRRELDKLLMHFGLPDDTSTVEIARRIIDDLRTAHAGTESDLVVLRETLSSVGEVIKVMTPMQGAALREGTVTGLSLEATAREIRRAQITRWNELAVLRNFAFEVAQMTGMSPKEASALASGELAGQELAAKLRPVKTDLRADGAAAERDASRRILDAVKNAVGDDEAGDTLLPGAVRAQRRELLAAGQVAVGVRAALVELGDASVQDRPDADLPGLVRLTVLTERFPIGATVEMSEGDIGVVHGVSAFLTDEMPLQVLFENGSTTWVSADQVRGVEYSPTSGVFKLPEGGLSGIFAKAKERAPKLPDMEKIDDAADRLADRIETWGERMADRINSAADRLATEIDDVVEKAREKGGK